MKHFWMTFTDGSHGCCDGENEYDAKSISEKLTGKVVAGERYKNICAVILPYPATPIIWQFDHPCTGKCPAFCYKPEQCKGHTACPQNYSCTE